jgi:hypothetical protein
MVGCGRKKAPGGLRWNPAVQNRNEQSAPRQISFVRTSFGPHSLYVQVTDANDETATAGVSRSGTQSQVGCR